MSSPEPQFKSISSSALRLLHCPTLTSVHNYRKKPQLQLYRPLLANVCMFVAQFWLMLCPWNVMTRFLCPWNSPGKNSGVGSHSLLQGIFPTQGSPTLQADYHLNHEGSTHIYVCVCMYVYTHTFVLVCTCVYIHICTCMYTCLYVYIHIHAHTYKIIYNHTIEIKNIYILHPL